MRSLECDKCDDEADQVVELHPVSQSVVIRTVMNRAYIVECIGDESERMSVESDCRKSARLGEFDGATGLLSPPRRS